MLTGVFEVLLSIKVVSLILPLHWAFWSDVHVWTI